MPVGSSVQSFTYDDLMFWAELQSGSYGHNLDEWFEACSQYGVGEEDALLEYLNSSGSPLNVTKSADGSYTGWFSSATEQMTQTNPINSNATTISRGNIRQMVGQKFEDVQGTLTRRMTRFPVSGGLGSKAAYVLGSVGSAFAAVSTGVALGKTLSNAIYQANPNYWDSIGMESFNPETWNGIVNDSNSPFAGMFNFILGLDPENTMGQMYMDQKAVAYMAYALKESGWFDSITDVPTYDPTVTTNITVSGMTGLSSYFNTFIIMYSTIYNNAVRRYEWTSSEIYDLLIGAVPDIENKVVVCRGVQTQLFFYIYDVGDTIKIIFSGTGSSTPEMWYQSANCRHIRINSNSQNRPRIFVDRLGETCYLPAKANGVFSGYGYPTSSGNIESNFINAMNAEPKESVEGVGNQPDATLPDVSDWDNVDDTLQSLQNQYPEMFANPMIWDEYNDDGTPKQSVWIPVPMPQATYDNDPQPVSGTQTQTAIDLSQINKTLSDLLTKIAQQTKPQTETESQYDTPPQNPITTGTGEPPSIVPPTGSASALWSVYHPTQAQVNSFGAWLWTDNIITQIQQLLQNPMEGIITLHKVFAPPVDSGQGTIVVGRLDSNVPSATVNQQYVTVDCGEVNCDEQFGNVFDYSPFTNISLYLPFIGIAPLSVNDIMRSKIHVTYGVDVFTGVCLAMVEVSRDGNTVNMYQYAGVASVEYPLTGTVHNGLITGIMGIVGGFATIATAGAAAPVAAAGGVAAAGAGALSTGRQSQSRSGNFSGNAGAMGIKKPYLIIERPQTKVADTFPELAGYPTNKSLILRECSGHVVVKHVHIEGVNATQGELIEIENLLQSGVLV